MNRSYLEKREWIEQQKEVPCEDCGNEFPPECMDFDHVEGKKEFVVSTGMYKTWAALLAEVAKCDIICANCHRIRTKQRSKQIDLES